MNFSKLRSDNPWGSYDDGNKKSSNGKKSNEPNVEDLLSQSQDFFKKLFGNGGGKKPQNENPVSKSLFGIIILVIISI